MQNTKKSDSPILAKDFKGFNTPVEVLEDLNQNPSIYKILRGIGYVDHDIILISKAENYGIGEKSYQWAERKEFFLCQKFGPDINMRIVEIVSRPKSLQNLEESQIPFNTEYFIHRYTYVPKPKIESRFMEDDIKDCVCIFIEVEYGEESYKATKFRNKLEADTFLRSFLKPTLMLDTGHSYQLIYKLANRISGRENHRNIMKVSVYLANQAEQYLDDVRYMFRLPFLFNGIVRNDSHIVTVVDFDPSCAYEFADLEKYACKGKTAVNV